MSRGTTVSFPVLPLIVVAFLTLYHGQTSPLISVYCTLRFTRTPGRVNSVLRRSALYCVWELEGRGI